MKGGVSVGVKIILCLRISMRVNARVRVRVSARVSVRVNARVSVRFSARMTPFHCTVEDSKRFRNKVCWSVDRKNSESLSLLKVSLRVPQQHGKLDPGPACDQGFRKPPPPRGSMYSSSVVCGPKVELRF